MDNVRAEAPRQQGEVSRELSIMESELACLTEHTGNLQTLLFPVLRPVCECDTDSPEEAVVDTEVGNQVRALRNMVTNVDRVILEILNRVSL